MANWTNTSRNPPSTNLYHLQAPRAQEDRQASPIRLGILQINVLLQPVDPRSPPWQMDHRAG